MLNNHIAFKNILRPTDNILYALPRRMTGSPKLKIFKTVIETISVFMVDLFKRKQFSPQKLFHNNSMRGSFLVPFYRKHMVAARAYAPSTVFSFIFYFGVSVRTCIFKPKKMGLARAARNILALTSTTYNATGWFRTRPKFSHIISLFTGVDAASCFLSGRSAIYVKTGRASSLYFLNSFLPETHHVTA